MAIYVEINGTQYPASITGRLNDRDWDNRESKAIEVEMSYSDAVNIFTDDVKWSIVQDIEETVERFDEESGNTIYDVIVKQESYDNSEYNIAGDIIDHRNGSITVKMGKPTAEEILAAYTAEPAQYSANENGFFINVKSAVPGEYIIFVSMVGYYE